MYTGPDNRDGIGAIRSELRKWEQVRRDTLADRRPAALTARDARFCFELAGRYVRSLIQQIRSLDALAKKARDLGPPGMVHVREIWDMRLHHLKAIAGYRAGRPRHLAMMREAQEAVFRFDSLIARIDGDILNIRKRLRAKGEPARDQRE